LFNLWLLGKTLNGSLLEGAASLHTASLHAASSRKGVGIGSAVRGSLSSCISDEGADSLRLELLLFTVLRLGWGSGLLNHVVRLVDGAAHCVPDLVDFVFSIKVSSHDIICLDKRI
jgi:hypothetical protein